MSPAGSREVEKSIYSIILSLCGDFVLLLSAKAMKEKNYGPWILSRAENDKKRAVTQYNTVQYREKSTQALTLFYNKSIVDFMINYKAQRNLLLSLQRLCFTLAGARSA